MSYGTMMVHLEAGKSNDPLLRTAERLARRFECRIVGIAGCLPLQRVDAQGYVCGDPLAGDREELEQSLKALENEFYGALKGKSQALEWRSSILLEPLAQYVAHNARCADVVLTRSATPQVFDPSSEAHPTELAMNLGRPLLVVPDTVVKLELDSVMVAWKDTPQARRAVHDALPLLKQAAQVSLVEIVREEELARSRLRLADVAAWLSRHGIRAVNCISRLGPDDVAALNAVAQTEAATVIVAGAYGHSRLREWVLGGVTRDLLLRTELSSFISH